MYLESVDKVFVHILDHYRSSAFSGGRSFDGPCRKSFALATEQEEQSLDAALSIDSVKLDLVEGPARGVNIGSASSQSPLASSIASASQLVTPEQYGQDTRLHMSASVPMFASYWKVDLLGEPIIGAKAVAIPLNLPPFAADQRGSSYSKRT
ncbi:unnamed protein product [Sphagnum tenellum]